MPFYTRKYVTEDSTCHLFLLAHNRTKVVSSIGKATDEEGHGLAVYIQIHHPFLRGGIGVVTNDMLLKRSFYIKVHHV
jgi:hypothetical protein